MDNEDNCDTVNDAARLTTDLELRGYTPARVIITLLTAVHGICLDLERPELIRLPLEDLALLMVALEKERTR